MSRWRKKPVEIDAVRVNEVLTFATHSWADLPAWIVEGYDKGEVLFLADCVEIKTPEGTMTGQRGDWIIKGVQDELYPCKPGIFAATYDPVG